jgi:hypothetical protein
MRLVDETRANAIWWEDEGRRIGETLDGIAAAVVTARDPEDAAAVALGIASVHARRRRAVVADLAGELSTFARLLGAQEGDGIVDTFRYGASLNHIARRVGPGENLYLLPSGTEPVVDEELYAHDRWRRLVAGFREADALLLLVAPGDAPGIAALTAHTDGAVVAGDDLKPPAIAVLARARTPGTERREPGARPPADAIPSGVEAPRRRSRLPLVAAVTTLAAAVVLAFALSPRWRDAGSPAPQDTVAVAANEAALPRFDSAAASFAPVAPAIANLTDSAFATGWSVELAKFNTPLGALYRVRDELPSTTPAATFGVVPIGADATLWYRVLVGATATRAAADSLVATLVRSRAIDDPRAALVVHTPLAFVIRTGLAPDSAIAVAGELRERGVPAYALREADGSTTVYAGAFETAEQAAFFVPALREAGIEPVLAYRTGRTR